MSGFREKSENRRRGRKRQKDTQKAEFGWLISQEFWRLLTSDVRVDENDEMCWRRALLSDRVACENKDQIGLLGHGVRGRRLSLTTGGNFGLWPAETEGCCCSSIWREISIHIAASRHQGPVYAYRLCLYSRHYRRRGHLRFGRITDYNSIIVNDIDIRAQWEILRTMNLLTRFLISASSTFEALEIRLHILDLRVRSYTCHAEI